MVVFRKVDIILNNIILEFVDMMESRITNKGVFWRLCLKFFKRNVVFINPEVTYGRDKGIRMDI